MQQVFCNQINRLLHFASLSRDMSMQKVTQEISNESSRSQVQLDMKMKCSKGVEGRTYNEHSLHVKEI